MAIATREREEEAESLSAQSFEGPEAYRPDGTRADLSVPGLPRSGQAGHRGVRRRWALVRLPTKGEGAGRSVFLLSRFEPEELRPG